MIASARELLLETAAAIRDDDPVPSPCISVCRMDAAAGWCEGCLRTLDEIAAWSQASEVEKRGVWQQLVKRAEQA
jgi:uncharacterized protein